MANVTNFPPEKILKKKPISVSDIEQVGFLTSTDRDLWIRDKKDIAKIIAFLNREKITIYEAT